MPQPYTITRRALIDIGEITSHKTAYSPTHAAQWLHKLFSIFEMLATHPFSGRKHPDLADQAHYFWHFQKYTIIYHTTEPLTIIRVLSTYRDLRKIL